MKRFIFFCLITLGISAKAQILKEKRVVLPDSSVLSYLVNQDKINGLYVIKKGNVDLARGNYVDNQRVGNWYFFNVDKSVFLRYNYDNKKLLFVDNKTLALASVAVKSDNEDVNSKASISMPIFSLEQYLILATVAAESAVRQDQQDKLNNKEVQIIAKVDKKGIAQYFLNYEIKGKTYQDKINLGVNVDWIPASYNGVNYDSDFSLKTVLSFSKEQGFHRKIDWNRSRSK